MKVPWRVVLVVALAGLVVQLLLREYAGLSIREARMLVFPFVVLGGFWIASRSWSKHEILERWARSRGVEASASTTPDVERYLQRQRKLTVAGGAVGFAVAWAYDRLTAPGSTDVAVVLFLVVPVVAMFLVAHMLAERTFVAEADGTIRRAEVVVRRLTDYVPERSIMLLRALGSGSVLIALVAVFFDGQADVGSLVVMGLATGAYALAVELSQRWRVRWPRPFESTEAAYLQDVLRADAIRQAMWGGVAATSAALTGQFIVLSRSLEGAGRALPLLGVLLMIVSAVAAYRSNVRGFSLAQGRPASSG